MSQETTPSITVDSDPGRERRVRVRHTQKLSTYAQRGTGDLDQVWWIGNVRNISGNGIGLTLQNRFEPGTQLTLELENASRTQSQTIQAEVVRVFPAPGGWYLGCTLRHDLSETDLEELLK
jgi:hypothetical protein